MPDFCKNADGWFECGQKEARTYLFSIGQPLVYENDGIMIAEYADGRIVPVH